MKLTSLTRLLCGVATAVTIGSSAALAEDVDRTAAPATGYGATHENKGVTIGTGALSTQTTTGGPNYQEAHENKSGNHENMDNQVLEGAGDPSTTPGYKATHEAREPVTATQ